MATQGPLGIYYDRWLALDKLIDSAIKGYSGMSAFPRQGTIVKLLHELRNFATGQFQLFYFGFVPSDLRRRPSDILLQSWDEYPPEDVLTGILTQISHDLALIQRAADQRYVAKLSSNTPVLDTLDAADKLTWLALVPAMRHQIIDKPELVLTYFDKGAEFYTIPYLKAALIAVPFTCTMVDNYQDFLAIPHEAGHYVYRHLIQDAKNALKEFARSSKIPERFRGWTSAVFEEMCADIFGCLVAGPVMAKDFEYLSLANSQTEFAAGDGDHPNAALRPLIYCQVLDNSDVSGLVVQNDEWHTIAGKLKQEWFDRLRHRHVDYFVVNQNRTEGQNQIVELQRQDIKDDYVAAPQPIGPGQYGALSSVVDGLIETLVNYVTDNNKKPSPHDLQGWAGKIDSNTNPADLFDCLKVWVDQALKAASDAKAAGAPWPEPAFVYPAEPAFVPEASAPYAEANPRIEVWRDRMILGEQYKGVWPPTDIMSSGEVKFPPKMDPGTWGYILYADGWTTGGPSNDRGHPLE